MTTLLPCSISLGSLWPLLSRLPSLAQPPSPGVPRIPYYHSTCFETSQLGLPPSQPGSKPLCAMISYHSPPLLTGLMLPPPQEAGSYSQHTPRCQASPTGNTREGHLMFVGSKALSAVPSLQTWILPASALSKICVWPRAHRQAVGIPVGRKSNTLANLTGGVLSKGQEPHQTQGSICRCQG